MGHQEALSLPSTHQAWQPAPAHLASSRSPWARGWQIRRCEIPEVRPRLWPLPSDPSPVMGEGFPGFCLYMAEERRRWGWAPRPRRYCLKRVFGFGQ